ncbi:MAG: N-6 DNA methylase [Methanobrevibacter sp.]|nr:N-6 DNA methylase [Methanosphaera sp.]MBR0371125.1 N-6 DNA methylase [Methanobrevibacter sp.]
MNDNKSFNEIFEELARHNDRSVIWNDFLDYAIEVNLLTLAKDKCKNEFKKNYHGNEEAYADLLSAWLNELNIKLEKYPYYDILGEFYEELVTSKVKSSQMGQFFSPVCVSELVNDLVHNDIGNTDLKNKIVNDPACGSARMLLEAHVKSKGEMFCLGEELEGTAARMAVLNFFSHGVRGSILQVDTLTREWFNGWRVNRYLYHGIPVPHIEIIHNENEALDFIELNRLNNNDDSFNDDVGVTNVVEKVVDEVTLNGGQTTLI